MHTTRRALCADRPCRSSEVCITTLDIAERSCIQWPPRQSCVPVIQLLHTSWMRQLMNRKSSWISISMSRYITASQCLLSSRLCISSYDRLLTDRLSYFLVQKQLTENEAENQKANVAAMRADVTADTTQIAHKILRCRLLQLHPASLQLLLHAGLHAIVLSVLNLAFLWPSSHDAYWRPTKTCESCSCDCYALAAVHSTRGVSGRRALKQACNVGWVLAQACPHRQCSAQGRLQGGQGGGVPPGCSCCGRPDSV